MRLVLFNIFPNDCFYALKSQTYIIFADDNTITATCNTLTKLLKTLKQAPESAVSWFKQNEMIGNADQLQAIFLNKKESEAKYKLTIDNNGIEFTKSVKLLGIKIDDQLYFDQHMSNLCFIAAMQLNALGQLYKNMGKPEKIPFVNSFIYANFDNCPLVWHLVLANRSEKLRKSKNIV